MPVRHDESGQRTATSPPGRLAARGPRTPRAEPRPAPPAVPPPPPARRSAWAWLIGFLKVGSVSFGGGAPSIPILQRELVEKGVLGKKEFADGLALANVTPGPILTNMAVYAGMRAAGALAAVVALTGALLPSLAVMIAATHLFLAYSNLPALKAALHAIQPVVIALLAMTVLKLGPASLASRTQIAVAAMALLALLAFKVHPGLLIVLVAAGALLLGRPSAADLQPGNVYLSVKRLPRLADVPVRCYAFVAIDGATCWVRIGVRRDNGADTAADFLADLLDLAPFKVSAVIFGRRAAFNAPGGRFEALCRGLGMATHIAGRGMPQPHMRIEQFSHRLSRVMERLHRQPFAVAAQTLERYARLHNEHQPKGAPQSATPAAAVQNWRASHPHLFVKGNARPTVEAR